MPPAIMPTETPARYCDLRAAGRFEFKRDSFAFANELLWEYGFDPATGKTTVTHRVPKPTYALRCFVVARAARLFLYHARFEPELPAPSEETCRRLIRQVLARNPRVPSAPEQRVVFPGYESLRRFSAEREALLKAECGAWRSYVLRSHWRMIFPVSRAHQARTAAEMETRIKQGFPPIVHLVRFPSLSINHGMVLYEVEKTGDGLRFAAYDPNDPTRPTTITFLTAARTFFLPANLYWVGGRVDVIEIYRSWFF
jgi:hypothetical protein